MINWKELKAFLTKERWTAGAYARRADGLIVWPSHPDAICWCLSGAVMKLYPQELGTHKLNDELYYAVVNNTEMHGVIHLNDAGRFEGVSAFLDKMIELEECS